MVALLASPPSWSHRSPGSAVGSGAGQGRNAAYFRHWGSTQPSAGVNSVGRCRWWPASTTHWWSRRPLPTSA